jgi:AAA family ATP:ADP antiporter
VLAGIRLIGRSPYLMRICLLMLLFTTCDLSVLPAGSDRQESFAGRQAHRRVRGHGFSVNALTLFIQLFWTGRIVKKIGLDWSWP